MLRFKTHVLAMLLLLACAVYAQEQPAPTTSTETIAPGLRYSVLHRGEAGAGKGFRVLLGVCDHQSDADHLLERARQAGVTVFPESTRGDYRIVSRTVTEPEAAEELQQRLRGSGLSALEIEETGQDLGNPTGPWTIHLLEVDPTMVELRVAHAADAAIGLETTAELATRHGAAAAVNGGYFRMEGLLAGDSQGVLRIEGRLLSEPDRGRAAVGFWEGNGALRSVFGRLGFRGRIRTATEREIVIDGINRRRQDGEIVLFTPEFHRTTLTPPDGTEVVIRDGRIVDIREAAGSSLIPGDGTVLSIGRERVEEVLPLLRRGEQVSVEAAVQPLLPDPDHAWEKAEFIVGGGPLLLWQGRRLEEPEKESISKVFFLARHPRTAVGARADGTLILVTVDGRRPGESVGMSIPELNDLMLELGCRFAINLDGGGSTTMVVNGRVVNNPSGSQARRNADAILLFPKASQQNK